LTWPKWQKRRSFLVKKKSRFGEKKAFLVMKKIGVVCVSQSQLYGSVIQDTQSTKDINVCSRR
jgi:hypothetical protein